MHVGLHTIAILLCACKIQLEEASTHYSAKTDPNRHRFCDKINGFPGLIDDSYVC